VPPESKENYLNLEYLRQKPRVAGTWEQATAHSVSSLTRLTRFRPSVWLPWSWGAQSGVVASLLHRPPINTGDYALSRIFIDLMTPAINNRLLQ
jgi:hypothetical protein